MSIKKLIEQTRNERMTESEKIKKLNEFFENSEADKLLQELKKLDLLNKSLYRHHRYGLEPISSHNLSESIHNC